MAYKGLLKVIFVFCVLAALALAGCGGNDKVITGTKTSTGSGSSSASSGSSAGTESASAASYDLTDAERQKALDAYKPGKKTLISSASKTMRIGDHYVFAVVIYNILPSEQTFRINPKFDNAKERVGSLSNMIIGIDEDYIVSEWFGRNRFTTIKLKSSEQAVVPVIVEAKPTISESKDTLTGSYTFNVDVEYEKTSQFWELYESDLLVIKVE